MSVDKTTDEPTVKEVQEQTSQPETTETPETTVETTEKPLGEILQDEPDKVSEKPEFKELYKKERKEKRQLEARLKKLEESIDDGASDDDIASDIDDLAEEFNVDKKFLKKLQKSIEAKFDERVASKLQPLEAKEKADKFNTAFNAYYDKAIEKMPEFKGIVNKDVIKTLATQPQNANKTLSQLIEETYVNALGGRRTIETTTPRGGVEPTEVDMKRAVKDPAYFKEVMADPSLKKKYNEGLAQRVLR